MDYIAGLQVDVLRNVVHNAAKLSLNESQRLTWMDKEMCKLKTKASSKQLPPSGVSGCSSMFFSIEPCLLKNWITF